MGHDGSLASKVEEWIVDQLNQVEEFLDSAVMFPGTMHPSGRELVDELLASRPMYTVVFFESDRPIVTQEGKQDYEPTYAIYIAVQNDRAGCARTGDDSTTPQPTPGTNLMRDRLRTALHDKNPGKNANGFATEYAEFRGVRIVYQGTGAFVMRADLVVREVPV